MMWHLAQQPQRITPLLACHEGVDGECYAISPSSRSASHRCWHVSQALMAAWLPNVSRLAHSCWSHG